MGIGEVAKSPPYLYTDTIFEDLKAGHTLPPEGSIEDKVFPLLSCPILDNQHPHHVRVMADELR